ncbi:MAG: hypothetical protein AAF495_25380 [Pseudomonadota bacterium]
MNGLLKNLEKPQATVGAVYAILALVLITLFLLPSDTAELQKQTNKQIQSVEKSLIRLEGTSKNLLKALSVLENRHLNLEKGATESQFGEKSNPPIAEGATVDKPQDLSELRPLIDDLKIDADRLGEQVKIISSREVETQDQIKSQFGQFDEKLNSIKEDIHKIEGSSYTINFGFEYLTAPFVGWLAKICIWVSWIATGITIVAPNFMKSILRSVALLKSGGFGKNLLWASICVIYILSMITGYAETLGNVLDKWADEVRHLYIPIIFLVILVVTISQRSWHWSVRSAASIVTVAMFSIIFLEIYGGDVESPGGKLEHYEAVSIMWFDELVWNRYAATALFLCGIIILYVFRMMHIISELAHETKQSTASA